MGRGRQKAKQTKVARDLKYHESSFDPNALTQELRGIPVHQPAPVVKDEGEEDEYSLYAKYIVDDDDEDEPPATTYASGSARR
jgi:hypothetical protein